MLNVEGYAECAEKSLERALKFEGGTFGRRDQIQIAQVYATLAVAAASITVDTVHSSPQRRV